MYLIQNPKVGKDKSKPTYSTVLLTRGPTCQAKVQGRGFVSNSRDVVRCQDPGMIIRTVAAASKRVEENQF